MTVDVKDVYEEICADEGKVLHAYFCSEHHKTVGIGHKVLGTDVENDLDIYDSNGFWQDAARSRRLARATLPSKAATNASGLQEPLCSFSFLPAKV